MTTESDKRIQELDIARRFALALDHEDYSAALDLLSPNSVYKIRGKAITGPGEIVDSYRGNGEAARSFDLISYGSAVRQGEDGWIVIAFWDELTHRGRTHRHECEQWVRVEDSTITLIEHRDLEGEVVALEEFKSWCFGQG